MRTAGPPDKGIAARHQPQTLQLTATDISCSDERMNGGHGDRIGCKGPGKTFEAGVKQTLPPPPMNYYW
ncbi:hypothetical protein DPEC_G00374900 [Dallia pectoralis]|nr:hypothetical protein DPEC_G00374900 [Dallia pectoralis]